MVKLNEQVVQNTEGLTTVKLLPQPYWIDLSSSGSIRGISFGLTAAAHSPCWRQVQEVWYLPNGVSVSPLGFFLEIETFTAHFDAYEVFIMKRQYSELKNRLHFRTFWKWKSSKAPRRPWLRAW